MIYSEETQKESLVGTLGVRENSATTGRTVMRGNSEMTEDTLLLARLRATVRGNDLPCLSSARARPRRLGAEDVGLLHQQNARDWLARVQEADTMTSLRLGLVARLAVVSLPEESARRWLVV